MNKIEHIDEFDIDVKQYLGYDEIQQIIMTTLPLQNWNERQKNIDMMMLHYCAGIPVETLENTDPDEYLQSGMIEAVKQRVINYADIFDGIYYHTSVSKLLYQIMEQMPEIKKSVMNSPKIKEIMRNGSNK